MNKLNAERAEILSQAFSKQRLQEEIETLKKELIPDVSMIDSPEAYSHNSRIYNEISVLTYAIALLS